MKYVSTRGSDKEYSFTEAFLNSYADDGGLMCPKTIPRLSEETLNRWSVGYLGRRFRVAIGLLRFDTCDPLGFYRRERNPYRKAGNDRQNGL